MQFNTQLQLELDLRMPLGIPSELGLQGRSRGRGSKISFSCLDPDTGRVVPVHFRATRYWPLASLRRQRFNARYYVPIMGV